MSGSKQDENRTVLVAYATVESMGTAAVKLKVKQYRET